MSTEAAQSLVDAYQETYGDNWFSTVQQERERLEGTSMIETDLDGKVHTYHKTGKRQMNPMTGRFENSNPTELLIETRQMFGVGYDDELKFSRRDQKRLAKLALPTSQGMAEQRKALARLTDQIKINALFGTSYVSKDGTGQPVATELPVENTIGVDFTKANPTSGVDSGMTLDKILRAKRKLQEVEFDEGEMQILLVGPSQVEDLYDNEKFINNEYRQKSGRLDTAELLATGRTQWVDTLIIRTNQLPVQEGTTHRKCVLYTKSSLIFGMENPESFMDLIATKKHQIQVRFEVDPIMSTRLEECGVYPILCAE